MDETYKTNDTNFWTERLVEFCQQMTTPAVEVKRETDQAFTFTDSGTGRTYAVMVFPMVDVVEEVDAEWRRRVTSPWRLSSSTYER